MSELSKIANGLLSKSAKFVNEKNGTDTSGHQYVENLKANIIKGKEAKKDKAENEGLDTVA